MTATLDDIHRDPAILDQAIARGESLEIVSNGTVTATLVPTVKTTEPDFLAREIARQRPPDALFSNHGTNAAQGRVSTICEKRDFTPTSTAQ